MGMEGADFENIVVVALTLLGYEPLSVASTGLRATLMCASRSSLLRFNLKLFPRNSDTSACTLPSVALTIRDLVLQGNRATRRVSSCTEAPQDFACPETTGTWDGFLFEVVAGLRPEGPANPSTYVLSQKVHVSMPCFRL